MQGRIHIVTAPSVEPVSLSEALTHCHADSSVEDSWFTLAIQAAREKAEEYQGRAYIEQVIEWILDGFPHTPALLPRSPVMTFTSLKYYDTADTEYSLTLTDLHIDTDSDPARIILDYGLTWPSIVLREGSSVIIRYSAGYGATAASVPAKVRLAILFLVGYWYENRAIEFTDPPGTFYDLLRPDRLHI